MTDQQSPASLAALPRVSVGPFQVADAASETVVAAIADAHDTTVPLVMCHLHVGSLNHDDDAAFVAAMNAADLVYADGMATVVIAKAAGSESITRAGLTDIGEEIVDAVAARLGRPVRLGLLGGEPGLAERAGVALAAGHEAEAVFAAHGYQEDAAAWKAVLGELRAAEPDIVFVGLGMPREALWAQEHLDDLPPAVILAAGGYYGHIAGDESRAPEWAQRVGLEWLWRVVQDPNKAARYAQGAFTTARLAFDARRNRGG